MKSVSTFFSCLILVFLISPFLYSQQYNKIVNDSVLFHNSQKEKPTQYRRGVKLLKGYQTYEQKYAGKNLNDEKKRLYPLGYGTYHPGEATSGTGIWTELNPKVPRVDYLGIHFVNPDTGWACGDLGTVIKTTDGGSSWTVEQTNTTTPILKVNSYNGQIVIASGYSGLILRSSDSGTTWTTEASGVTGDLWGLQMINDTLGWACGNSNSFIKTTDGGLTWQAVTNTGLNTEYWWIDFMNKGYGFVACDNGIALKTTDGGNSWTEHQAGDNNHLFSVDVIDSLHIAAGGNAGKHVYSSDGGVTWVPTPMYQLPNEPVNCVKYINIDTGYIAVGEMGLYKTTNRGTSWQVTANIGEYEIQLYPEYEIGYAAGTGLKIDKADGNLDVWNKLIINDDFYGVYFTSERKGYAISLGRLYRSTNYGESWDTVEGLPGGGCITFTDSLTGYVGTQNSKIYKTIDGGGSWYQTNGITNTIAKIFFINHHTGWAAGGYRIFKTTDSGDNWFEQLYDNVGSFNGISFVDSLYGWASNLSEWLYETTDGGLNWIQQTNSNIYSTRDIFFKDSLNGFAVKTNQLYETTDSGNNWNLNSYVSGFSFAKFSHYADSTILLVGYKVYRTTDGGNNWVEFPELLGKGLVNSSLINSGLGYAAGKTGLIMKYYDSTYTPVELISFKANSINNKVFLNWSTATEINNRGFEIQKSTDKINWQMIGFVKGNGTTTKKNYYSYIDNDIEMVKYYYRLKQIDFDGSIKCSKVIEVNINAPSQFSLSQNYPNPFNPETNINYTIPKETNVILKLYDITGREVKELVNERKQPGEYTVKLKGGNLSSGVYFFRLITSSGYTAVKKLILLK
jgi:photosystem II stability/assembly factor-like uncharacterized protein